MKFSVEYYYLMKFMAEHDSSSKTDSLSFSLDSSLSINNSFSKKLPEYCQKAGMDSEIFEKKISEYSHKTPDSYSAQRFISHKKKEIKAYESMRDSLKMGYFRIQRSSIFSDITKYYLTPWFIDFIFERKLDKHYLNVHKLDSWFLVMAKLLTNNKIEESERLWKHCSSEKITDAYSLADSLILSELKFQPDFITQLKKIKNPEFVNFLSASFNMLSLKFIEDNSKKHSERLYPYRIAHSFTKASVEDRHTYEKRMYDRIEDIRIFFEKISLENEISLDTTPVSGVKRPSRL